jgi:hypothetical protein
VKANAPNTPAPTEEELSKLTLRKRRITAEGNLLEEFLLPSKEVLSRLILNYYI